jgi:hypothetical protein
MKRKNRTSRKPLAPAGEKRAVWRSPWFLLPLLALLDSLVIELFNHKVFTVGFSSFARFVSRFPLAFAVDFLLVLATLVPAFFLRRRAFWCTLVSAVWLIAGGVNGFILMSRMTPFTTADLTVLNTGLDTLPNYMSTGYIVLLAVALAALVAALVLLLLKGPRSQDSLRRRLLSGAAALVLALGALGGCWVGAKSVSQLSTVFPNLAFAYEDYGFPYCFLQTWLNTGVRCPNGYDAGDIARIRKEIDKDAQPLDAQTDVNVVYVQLESFMDTDEIKGLELNEDPLPFWHEMENTFTTGYLHVPVVGAGTANTEFEMLTGMSSQLFGPGEYPYKTCLQDQAVESVANDLSSLGYATHAIHNHRATFYTRNIVYANLGFDDFTSLEYMPRAQKTPKGWAKDYILTNQIDEALDASPDQADLVFTVSVQGHGSYPTEPLLTDPAITVTACPENCNSYAVEYYVNQIHEMDEFLQALTNRLADRGEKTVLVLYGDHLPSLGLEKHDMESGSLYKTRYIVWDNFGLQKEDKDVYAYQLSAAVMKQLGISQGDLMRFHQFCQEEPTYRTDLKELQYDVLYGEDYLYAGGNPYQATEMKMGMEPIQITGLYEKDGYWYVQGVNFSPYCRVKADDELLDTSYVNTRLLRINEDPGVTDVQALSVSVVDMHKEVLSDTELD